MKYWHWKFQRKSPSELSARKVDLEPKDVRSIAFLGCVCIPTPYLDLQIKTSTWVFFCQAAQYMKYSDVTM